MLEKNKADSRKYFIFKIRDLVHNSFHTLEEKRTESLLQYMGICISTYDELRASLDPTKLKRSYEGLLEGLDYQMQIHPFHKLDLYQNDFSHLHQLINLANEARDKELHNIHRSIVALKKKLEAENLINCYIQCLLTETTFKGMDYLMEALISDLLYAGHSMSHILDFFKRQQQEFLEHNDAEKTIQNLNEFDRKPIPFSIHICFKISSQTQKELALNLIKQQFEIHTNQELGIPHINNDTLIASKEYLALDEFKAIDLAQKEFQSVLLLCFSRLLLSDLGLCLHFLLFLLCLLCLLLHEVLDVPSGFFIKAIVTVIHDYGTFLTENHIGCSCSILLMLHQKPFLLVHQDVILCKPCSFLSFDFVPGCINGKSGIGRTFDCEKFWNDDKTIFVDIVSCGFSIVGDDDHITATNGMTFEVLRSLLL